MVPIKRQAVLLGSRVSASRLMTYLMPDGT